MSETMVERAAKAIHDAYRTDEWESTDPNGIERTLALRQARAAIEAMLEPTDAMVAACDDAAESIQGAGWTEIYRRIYRAMIEAATRGE